MDAGNGPRGIRSEINITPLVDVVLVLLIIFMCFTPVIQLGHPVQVPPTKKGPAAPPEPQLILRLDRGGRIYLNSLEIPRLQLAAKLEEVLSTRSTQVVFLAADGELPYGQVADFLDGLRTGKPAAPTFREALEANRVCDAIIASGKTEQWVTL
jgi:biopolymer transport protein TolR